ncbi:hypothetical protein OG205_28340 [Lentzea sp. NBC_00516]|uniref:hypothetical protein n=1 Tax=Lentzea sp. NBC_00516 TaxID=2903582 RepID=UPI002E820CBC|nr:hypothetical protein [Lentzea sp. NBC_00516]WUD22008.1 hypothetical protein OG205_28340 [Lentzea sp. NBC_00516]
MTAMPSWRDTTNGTMVRGALWLEQEVGLGNKFTKTDLRNAFPDVSQIDRRLRDLRDHGWQIDTNREDALLRQQEQRYVQRGAEVWVPGQAKTKPKAALTAAQRSKVFSDDGFLCRSCGIAPGDSYDDMTTAQLDVARRSVTLPDGTQQVQLITECNRCRVGGRGREDAPGAVLDRLKELGSVERKILVGWIEADERRLSDLETLWGAYRALPADSRMLIRQAVQADEKPEA